MTRRDPVYPVALVLSGRRCLVVGGGRVAARKIAALVECGASVTVVAPEVHDVTAELTATGVWDRMEGPPLNLQLRPYRRGEVAGYRLVVVATGDRAVADEVYRDAEAAGVWVNSADDLAHCTVELPAVARHGEVTVAVSTGGSSPALASWLRARIAGAIVTANLGALAELLGETRQELRGRGARTDAVGWAAILDGSLPALVRQGRIEEARRILSEAVAGIGPDPGRGGRASSPGWTSPGRP